MGVRWVSSRLARRCRGSRIRGCCAAAAAMSTTSCCRAWPSATCCARRMPMRASASIDTTQAKAAPGVLAVLTGADWKALRLGRPAGARRAEAPRRPADVSRRRYPALVQDRVRWVGDYVAFVVAETLRTGDRRRRADRGRLRAAAGGHLDRRRGGARRAARVGRLPGQHLLRSPRGRQGGDRRGLRARRPRRQHRFVINRVTAVTMEPRGCIGDYDPADGRYTLYTQLQRAARLPLGPRASVLKVPESKVRVIAGDIGGSFGMKSAIFNEVAAGAARLEAHRPAGEMDRARARRPFSATRRRATTSPTPSLRSTRTARSSACG